MPGQRLANTVIHPPLGKLGTGLLHSLTGLLDPGNIFTLLHGLQRFNSPVDLLTFIRIQQALAIGSQRC